MARRPKNPVATTLGPADFASLAETVREDNMATGGSRFANNPFVPLLRQSYEFDQVGKNGVKALDITGAQVAEVVVALRNAAIQLANEEIGIRIRYRFVQDDGTTVEIGNEKSVPKDERPVTVKFLGRPKKIYLTDAEKAEAVEHGFVIGEGDKARPDTARYLAWKDEANEPDESEDDDSE